MVLPRALLVRSHNDTSPLHLYIFSYILYERIIYLHLASKSKIHARVFVQELPGMDCNFNVQHCNTTITCRTDNLVFRYRSDCDIAIQQ